MACMEELGTWGAFAQGWGAGLMGMLGGSGACGPPTNTTAATAAGGSRAPPTHVTPLVLNWRRQGWGVGDKEGVQREREREGQRKKEGGIREREREKKLW